MGKDLLLKILNRMRDELKNSTHNTMNLVFDLDQLIDQINDEGLVYSPPRDA